MESCTWCRQLYYTDWGDEAKVVRCNLDGSGRTVLLRGVLQNPNGLAVSDSTLYVVDSRLKDGSTASSVLIKLSVTSVRSDVNWTVTNLSHIKVLTHSLCSYSRSESCC